MGDTTTAESVDLVPLLCLSITLAVIQVLLHGIALPQTILPNRNVSKNYIGDYVFATKYIFINKICASKRQQ